MTTMKSTKSKSTSSTTTRQRRRQQQKQRPSPSLQNYNNNNNNSNSTNSGLFLNKDNTPTTALLLLLASIPLALLYQNSYKAAITCIVASLLIALSNAINQIKEEEKHEIRYNVLKPHDIIREMKEWEQLLLKQQQHKDNNGQQEILRNHNNDDYEKGKLIMKVGLDALAKKYGKAMARQRQRNRREQNGEENFPIQPKDDIDIDELALLCQEASYIGLRCYSNHNDNDEQDQDQVAVIASSISLLALCAKNTKVKERHLYEADKYGLDVPINALKHALQRTIDDDDEQQRDSTKREQQCAELQRKGCLLLGALASSSSGNTGEDDDNDNTTVINEMSSQVVSEGGLDVILNAVNWFRYHSDVANWALWSIFTLCYENRTNKAELIRANGVPIVLQTIQNNCCSSNNSNKNVEVARHGTAILFDLMRENDDDDDIAAGGGDGTVGYKLDIWKIRSSAVDAGLHTILLKVMNNFAGEMDIIMMGQEILIGTGYNGNVPVPQFNPLASTASG